MVDQITWSMIKNDLQKNKGINGTLFLFIFLSALLMMSGALIINLLIGAIDEMNEVALPPHYLQMHVGEFDEQEVQTYAEQMGLVEHTQFQYMFNLDGASISFERGDHSKGSFSNSVLDNYFVTQNPKFDRLVNLDNQVVQVEPGEIGLPLYYAKRYDLDVGDLIYVTLDGQIFTFKINTIIRDAQMGSSLASSIRFLLHDDDFNELYDRSPRHETIISFRLRDSEDINQFNELYNLETAHMPKNGVGITLPLINMVNGIGDGIMSGLIILVGLILISIAILSMRFTIASTIEDEIREIGSLRAIGINTRDINKLYIAKYGLLTLVATLLAVICSYFVVNKLVANVSLNFGVSKMTAFSYLIPLLVAALLFAFVSLFLKNALKSISKMSIVSALVDGELNLGRKKRREIKPLKMIFSNIDFSLSLHDYRIQLRSWLIYSLVFLLGSAAILIPLSMYMTLTSPDFVNYIGAMSASLWNTSLG